MASNAFGTLLRVTTFGESHGPAIGVVIDGCPAGVAIDAAEIEEALVRRATGQPYTSPRREADRVEVLSGLFEGQTTGTPLALLIRNSDADPSKYEPIKHLVRPGHANQTYLTKYEVFDYRGAGRASARETVARVAAGAVARKLCTLSGITITGHLSEIGGLTDPSEQRALLELLLQEGDSVGGVVEVVASGMPVGLGDPIYEKLEALLAAAMLSLPAAKGFEIGDGFAASRKRGSESNDLPGPGFTYETNHSGGTLGGISSGQPLVVRVAFKAASSIRKGQSTVDLQGRPAELKLAEGSRHDPCVAIRAVPVVEAMVALVLADRILMNRSVRW